MSSEIVPSSFPTSRSDEFPAGRPSSDSEMKPPGTSPAGASGPSSNPTGPGTASTDDLGLSLDRVCPDPLLEDFLPGSAESAALSAPDHAPADDFSRSTPAVTPPAMSPPGSWPQLPLPLDLERRSGVEPPADPARPEGAYSPVAPPKAEPVGHLATAPAPNLVDQPLPHSTSGLFPAIDLSAPTASTKAEATKARARRPGAEPKDEDDDDDGFEDGPSRGGSNWPMALLASYASAVTIGLIWVLWGHRAPRESVEPDFFPPADNAADPGRRADQSRKLVPPSPLPADRVARFGQTLRLGSLEVTPLEVSSGPVVLRHAIKEGEMRRGGEAALALRLRLKNISSDSILAPMDEAFLRERGRGVNDSFVESGPTRQVGMFPLAVVSEWSIVGQDFRELRPGESYETLAVTAPDAAVELGPDEWTWRIRLRTDINQTETVGVRFRASDVVPRPGPPLRKGKEAAKDSEWEDDL